MPPTSDETDRGPFSRRVEHCLSSEKGPRSVWGEVFEGEEKQNLPRARQAYIRT